MIQSMTGYGKAVCEYQSKKITVEIKSLNSKQLDLSVKLPFIYREKEMQLRNELATQIGRGKSELSINIENNYRETATLINQNTIENYYQQIKAIAQNLEIDEPTDWFATLLRLPETIKTEQQLLDEAEWNAVYKTIQEALTQFKEFRLQEGRSLLNIFKQKTDKIESLLTEVEQYEGERIAKIKSRLNDNLTALNVDFDKNRFEQELIFYIEKLDINEEKVRLYNHLKYFNETMNNEANSGKKLGFIAQEMGREINTLGAKSNHSEMQIVVVKMKDELEQIKEQVLNVL